MFDIVNELREYGIEPYISDPWADADEARRLYGVEFTGMGSVRNMDAVIFAVAHREFAEMSIKEVGAFFGGGRRVLIDVKGIFSRSEYEAAGYLYWRL